MLNLGVPKIFSKKKILFKKKKVKFYKNMKIKKKLLKNFIFYLKYSFKN